MPALLIPVLWLLWLGYWLLRARDNKASLRREDRRARAGRLLFMATAGLLLMLPAPLRHGLLGHPLWPVSLGLAWAGCALTAAGLGFAVWARLHLGRNWSGTVTIKQDHELIRSGPYGLSRHPIYTGLLTALLGSALASGHAGSLLALLLIGVVLGGKMRLEERWMEEIFGEQYRRYRAEVKAIIPFVW